jgi:hypothetical protein
VSGKTFGNSWNLAVVTNQLMKKMLRISKKNPVKNMLVAIKESRSKQENLIDNEYIPVD